MRADESTRGPFFGWCRHFDDGQDLIDGRSDDIHAHQRCCLLLAGFLRKRRCTGDLRCNGARADIKYRVNDFTGSLEKTSVALRSLYRNHVLRPEWLCGATIGLHRRPPCTLIRHSSSNLDDFRCYRKSEIRRDISVPDLIFIEMTLRFASNLTLAHSSTPLVCRYQQGEMGRNASCGSGRHSLLKFDTGLAIVPDVQSNGSMRQSRQWNIWTTRDCEGNAVLDRMGSVDALRFRAPASYEHDYRSILALGVKRG